MENDCFRLGNGAPLTAALADKRSRTDEIAAVDDDIDLEDEKAIIG
jgi:hypothetical protein